MTSLSHAKASTAPSRASRAARARARPSPATGGAGYWPLQNAKARFSELVRKARIEGPQHVTLHGREQVVVIAAEEFARLSGDLTGAMLVAASQALPYRNVRDIDLARVPMPVREVKL
jgi:prevent-host-death family protein